MDTGFLVRPILFFAIVIAVFICPSQISRSDALMEVGLDWQVMLKLSVSAFAACIGVWGFLTTPVVRRMLLTAPAAAIAFILVLAVPPALSGGSLSALPCIMINLSFMVFVATCLYYLHVYKFITALLIGAVMVSGAAWCLYLLVPEYGVFKELLGDGLVVRRLGGMAHPNSVGRTAGLGIISLIALTHQGRVKRHHALCIGAFLLFTLFWTVSRTATVACMAGVLLMFVDQIRSRGGLNLIAMGTLSVMLGVFALGTVGKEDRLLEKIVGSVSKTGDAAELATGTGRVDIWAESIRLIGERPLTGYGFGSAPELLLDFSQSTHNMYLHAGLVAGVAALGMMVIIGLWLLNVTINSEYKVVRALALFILISGMFEETVLETFPGPATLAWLVVCLHPLRLPRKDVAEAAEDLKQARDPQLA